MRKQIAVVVLCAVTLSGCYHATIETGLPSSNDTVSNSFAPGWIYGLVPPSTVATAAKCPNGVAKVETQLSFVNMLVGDLTLGIFTPMSIVATCATKATADAVGSGAADITVAAQSDPTPVQDAFKKAADVTAKTRKPVFVRVLAER